jgi:EpsI family protein
VIGRAIVLSTMILAAGGLAVRGSGAESPAPRQALAAFPVALGEWTAASDAAIDPAAREILRADDYLDRDYRAASGRLVNLSVTYYGSQRQGAAIHSPQNCLPGSGWQPVETRLATLRLGDREIPVNRYVIERRGIRQLAYYWYQGRGRVVANEFANKFWLMVDAAGLRRSDGALVRVMTLLDPASPSAADTAGVAFIRDAFPLLARFVP